MNIEKVHTRAYIMSIDDISDSELEYCLNQLPQWRREKALSYKYVQGRKECAFAYKLLLHALKEEYAISGDVEFICSEHGKPSLKGFPQIHFNLSHCKRAVACIVGDSPVGIDIERVGRYSESLARHVLNDDELRLVLASTDRDRAFIKLWTQKEALLKLTGEGISSDMKSTLTSHPEVLLHTDGNDHVVWSCAMLREED